MNEYEKSKAIPSVVDTGVLLEAVADEGLTRRYIAGLYGIALRVNFGQTDWSEVNRALRWRCKMSGLKSIEKLAWKAIGGTV